MMRPLGAPSFDLRQWIARGRAHNAFCLKEGAMWWNDYWPMPMFFGLPIMLVIMIFCLVMMFVMMRGMRHRSRNGYAAEILKERFARGEINQAEYDERRRVLET